MLQKVWGYHLILNLKKCNDNVTRKENIYDFVKDLVPSIGMVAYGQPIIEHFAEQVPEAAGYSLVQLIETSAITGHFSDLTCDAYIDIFSCKKFDKELAIGKIREHFAPSLIQELFLERDAAIIPVQMTVIPDKREIQTGTCNGCGICCHSDAIIVKEEGISHFLDLHGMDYPEGVEQLLPVMLKKLDKNTIQFTLFERCKNAKNEDSKTICGDYKNRPEKCRKFPSSSFQIRQIPQCSYKFKEEKWVEP